MDFSRYWIFLFCNYGISLMSKQPKYPNDMELGARIREYVRALFKGEESD